MSNDNCIYYDFKSGDIIIKEGDPSYGCYVLLSGKVGIYKNGSKVSETNEKGMVFGEISLILDIPRTATVIALSDTQICYFKTDLDTLITKYPSVVNKIVHNLAEQLENTTNDLSTTIKIIDDNEHDRDVR